MKAALEHQAQQDHRQVRIDVLLARLMSGTGLPGIEEADEIGERVTAAVPRLILFGLARQAGGMTSDLAERDVANIAALRSSVT